MANKLKVLCIGCGGRARGHMAAIVAGKTCEIVAVCDLDEKRLNECGDKFSIERRYTDMKEAIRKEKADLVNIVTPPTIRVGIVQDAISAGAKNINIEKPIALKPSESRALVELGKKAFISVNTQYQWMPHWQRFWGLLKEKALGEITSLRVSTRANILEQGPHVLDLALNAARISGLPSPQWVLAGASGLERFGKDPVPKDTVAVVGLGDARLHMTHGPSAPDSPGEDVMWYHILCEILGTKGRIWVSLNRGWTMWREGKFESGETGWPKNDGEAQEAMFDHLARVIPAGKTSEFPTRIDVAAKNSDVMFAAFASAVQRRRVDISEQLADSVVSDLEALA